MKKERFNWIGFLSKETYTKKEIIEASQTAKLWLIFSKDNNFDPIPLTKYYPEDSDTEMIPEDDHLFWLHNRFNDEIECIGLWLFLHEKPFSEIKKLQTYANKLIERMKVRIRNISKQELKKQKKPNYEKPVLIINID